MQDKRPICAIATAPGQGAIGVVRVSAPDVTIIAALAQAICGRALLPARRPAAAARADTPPAATADAPSRPAEGGAAALAPSASTLSLHPSVHPAHPTADAAPPAGSGLDTSVPGSESNHSLSPRVASYGPFLAADGQPIDYGLALWFAAPHSYTGEHVLELQGHGGPVVQQILLRRMLEVGANFDIRLAEPGEFTQRAFLNDKLDLVQAEAVADLIEASTEQAARSATRSLQGVFSGQVNVLADQLLHLRMLVEATLDFPEEEIEFLERADATGQLDAIDATLRQLLATARNGARLRQGLNVVLTGAPNVGKSSLLNALAGAEVAIVTPIAGTTRDRVIEQISIEGVPINLIDTAGLRETDDVVERIGIERTWAEIGKADVVVHLMAVQQPGDTAQTTVPEALATDSAAGIPAAPTAEPMPAADDGTDAALIRAIEAQVPASTRRLTVINKIDLLEQGGVLPAEAGDMAGIGRCEAEAPGGGELAAQVGTPASGSDATSSAPTSGVSITGIDGQAEADVTSDRLYLSARTGEGIEAFRRKLLDIAGFQPGAEGVFIARERHLQALQQAMRHLDEARAHIAQGDASLDLFAEELRLAHHALGQITGAVSADELLGVIFSRFCIGK